MTKQDFINKGGKLWIKNDMERVYITSEVFNEIMKTGLGDNNNKFFFDCKTNRLMRSYKGKKAKIEKQY
jgi:hypothetical protein